MGLRRDLLALAACLVGIALFFRFQSPARPAASRYEVDNFGLGVEVAELERRLGPQSRVSSGLPGESWISYGNSHDLAFLINPGLKTFAVRGSSVWREGRQILARGAGQGEIERELGTVTQVSDSDHGNSRRMRYDTYGLDLVLWTSHRSGELQLRTATLRSVER
ncbi:MAG: hypothetical protein KF760_25425 [Candidatus Eremiobacteraeota bacterium]|nr:hypothetical protein [Candidatus Eremiobacteraeota bacterium]MCW5866818.1 hypothetical protein [Candidatus Eremiobacteraeota bacterium]